MTTIFASTVLRRKRESIEREPKPGVQHISEILPLVLARIEAVESATVEAEPDEAGSLAFQPCLVGQS